MEKIKDYKLRRVEEPIAELPPLRTVLEDFPHVYWKRFEI